MDELKERYRNEEITSSNWYLVPFSKIDSVKIDMIMFSPKFIIQIDIYSDNSLFDKRDAMDFCVLLEMELSFIGVQLVLFNKIIRG